MGWVCLCVHVECKRKSEKCRPMYCRTSKALFECLFIKTEQKNSIVYKVVYLLFVISMERPKPYYWNISIVT